MPHLALMIPIIIFMIPIIAILTHHQRQMAEIVHRRGPQPADLELLRREVQELKQLVHQQAIAMDTFMENQRKLNQPTELQGRIG